MCPLVNTQLLIYEPANIEHVKIAVESLSKRIVAVVQLIYSLSVKRWERLSLSKNWSEEFNS